MGISTILQNTLLGLMCLILITMIVAIWLMQSNIFGFPIDKILLTEISIMVCMLPFMLIFMYREDSK